MVCVQAAKYNIRWRLLTTVLACILGSGLLHQLQVFLLFSGRRVRFRSCYQASQRCQPCCHASSSEEQRPEVSAENPWREDAQLALQNALALVDAQWVMLGVEADAAEADAGLSPAAKRDANEDRRNRAAELLITGALDRLRPHTVPTEYLDIPPLSGAEDALDALIGPDNIQVVSNFFSESEPLGPAARSFWQAELYLRELDEVAGETKVEEAAVDAGQRVDSEPAEMQKALRGSVLLARQNFISAARFGYFLRRGRQRLEVASSFGSSFKSLESWMGSISPASAVELARPATHEAQRAFEYRAAGLFGSELELLRQLERGPKAVTQLSLSKEARRRLSFEAAAFGAALFEAEAAASSRYKLDYTADGSRAAGPLG